jgi:plastocyanin
MRRHRGDAIVECKQGKAQRPRRDITGTRRSRRPLKASNPNEGGPAVRFHSSDHEAPRRISTLATLALIAGALALGGCGGSKGTSSSSVAPAPSSTESTSTSATTTAAPTAAGAVSVAANTEGQLKYDTTSLSAKAGKVTVAFTNQAPLAHNFTIASSSGTVVGATPTFQGGSKTLSLNLKPGAYKFYCTVPGHRQAGMEGTLVVK